MTPHDNIGKRAGVEERRIIRKSVKTGEEDEGTVTEYVCLGKHVIRFNPTVIKCIFYTVYTTW